MTHNVTRIAPSPTGMFHLGTARTALFNYLVARSTGGRFILRIDDTDVARNNEAFVDVIHDALGWLGVVPDEVHRQSERLHFYSRMGEALLAAGLAEYRPDEFVDGKAPLRLKLTDQLAATLPEAWTDEIKGSVRFSDSDRKLVDGLVLIRSDGNPTYHFASMFDDLDLMVNYVIRGVDHVANTAKQIAIKNAIQIVTRTEDAPIRFAHLGLIDIKDDAGKRKKLSKRDSAASLLHFRDAGVPAAAMIQFLLRLGWSASDPNFEKTHKVVTLSDAIDLFATAGRMGNSPVLFDQAKLDSLTRIHSRQSV